MIIETNMDRSRYYRELAKKALDEGRDDDAVEHQITACEWEAEAIADAQEYE